MAYAGVPLINCSVTLFCISNVVAQITLKFAVLTNRSVNKICSLPGSATRQGRDHL